MQDRRFAYKDPDGTEYVRERSGAYERLRKADRPSGPSLLSALKSLLGLR